MAHVREEDAFSLVCGLGANPGVFEFGGAGGDEFLEVVAVLPQFLLGGIAFGHVVEDYEA
ncbi:hypothetical protein D3C83_306580 [compost metagenome]